MDQKQIHVPNKIIYRHDGTTDVFICKEQIGHGGFAVVYRVMHQSTNKSYAMKIISKNNYIDQENKKTLEQLQNEIEIQKNLRHPNIVRLFTSFSDEDNYYIILEYCQRKSIREYLKKSGKKYLNETETVRILNDIICGLVYLHKQKIIHHDLKLENFLIGSDGKIKIADFGVSTILKSTDEKSFCLCGTTNYMSPELLQNENNGHSFEVDVWAIGVSAFMLLTGQYPFGGFEKDFIYEKIKNCEYSFPSNIQISNDAKNFIDTIFNLDPSKRPTANELLKYPFLLKYNHETTHILESSMPTKCKLSSSKCDISELANHQNYSFYKNRSKSTFVNTSISCKSTHSLKNNYQSIHPHENECDNITEYSKFEPNTKSTFIVPNHFVTKFTIYYDDLAFILGDGTVGICFDDGSRIVMDPNEKFVQYYKSYNSYHEIFIFEEIINNQVKKQIQVKIKLCQKFAKNFKKYVHLYNIMEYSYDPTVPLYHIKDFVKKNDSILFRLNDNNIQMNFSDCQKLIIFNNMKKICILKYFNEKCNLLKINDVIIKNQKSEEYKIYRRAEKLLSTIL